MATKKATNQNKKNNSAAGQTMVKRAAAANKKISQRPTVLKPSVKPQVRISRVSVGLGMRRPAGEGVVNLKGLAKTPKAAVKAQPSGKYYGGDVYDDELERGEFNGDDELLNEPVESLGELLAEDERLAYADAPAAATVKPKTAKAPRPSVVETGSGRIYKKLAVGFIILVLAVSLVAAYFILVKVKIGVTLKNEVVNDKLSFAVYDQSATTTLPANALKGLVKRIEIEQSKAWPVSGTEVIGEEVSGQMTIYNKYIKNQPLVATTRLLGADGKLFRLKNSVNIPAGGQLQVEVYADQPKADMTVGDEHFTIPGLWEGLQDKIYAESKAGDIAYKKRTKGIVSQADIDKAMAEMKQALITQAKTEIENSYGDFKTQLYKLDDAALSSEIDSKVGEEKEQIVIKLKGAVLAVAFNGEEAIALANQQAAAALTGPKQSAGLDMQFSNEDLLKVDAENKTAEVSAPFTGQVTITSLDNLIDKQKLTNLNADQLAAYLKSIPELASFNISFYPPFIHKTPALVDRIEVVLEK